MRSCIVQCVRVSRRFSCDRVVFAHTDVRMARELHDTPHGTAHFEYQ